MTKNVKIEGSVALVTGANRGIGKALVDALIAKGASKVYAGARDTSSLEEVFADHGDKVVPVQLDVTDADQVEQAAETVGEVDILINNAGVLTTGGFGDKSVEKTLIENFTVNVHGLVRVTEALLPNVKAAVANVSSVAGLAAMGGASSYSASKAAVHSLTQSLRSEMKESDLLIAGIYPGPIDTDMAKPFPFDKETPENTAMNIVNGLEAGDTYIFPDPFSKQFGETYLSAPAELEKQM